MWFEATSQLRGELTGQASRNYVTLVTFRIITTEVRTRGITELDEGTEAVTEMPLQSYYAFFFSYLGITSSFRTFSI